MKMKICPRLLIFELLDCTLRIFSGYDFSIFLILLFLDRYFWGFDSDLQASPPYVQLWSAPRKIEHVLFPSVFFEITDPFDGRSFLMCSHDPTNKPFGTNKNGILKNGSCEQAFMLSYYKFH